MSKYGKDVGVIYDQLVETFRLSAAPEDDKSSSGKAIILLSSDFNCSFHNKHIELCQNLILMQQ